MVPLMIETMAKKLEEASLLPAKIVKSQVFGKQFHTICSGGAYLDPAYIDLFNKYDITILQGYGMTECAPVISTTVSWNIHKDSVGQLIPNCQAKTVDGELWVKGSSVMQGVLQNARRDSGNPGGRMAENRRSGFMWMRMVSSISPAVRKI